MSSSNHSPQGTGIYAEEVEEKTVRARGGDEHYKEMVSSRHKTNAYMNSEAVAAHTGPTQVQD